MRSGVGEIRSVWLVTPSVRARSWKLHGPSLPLIHKGIPGGGDGRKGSWPQLGSSVDREDGCASPWLDRSVLLPKFLQKPNRGLHLQQHDRFFLARDRVSIACARQASAAPSMRRNQTQSAHRPSSRIL